MFIILWIPCYFNDFSIILKYIYNMQILARVAQLVEQWIEDPRVTSSNLVLGKSCINNIE